MYEMTQQLRTLALAATPGPWTFYDDRNDAKTNRMEIVAVGKTVARIYQSVPEEDYHNAAYIAAVSPDAVIALLDQIDALTARFDEAGRYAVMQAGQIDVLKAERDKLRYAAQAGRQAMIDHGRAHLGHLKQYTGALNELIYVLDTK